MLSNLSRIKLTKSRLLNLQRFILVQLCSFALLGICLLDIVLRVLENNAVFTICVTCFFASLSLVLLILSSRKVYAKNSMQNIPSPYIPISPGDLPKKPQWLISAELLRSTRLRTLNRPPPSSSSVYRKGPSESLFSGVNLKQAAIRTPRLLEERLASSGVPLRSRLKNESVRSYVLRLVGTAGRARRAAEMYLDIYEELRFTDAEISEAQYRDFLKLFAVVIDSLDLLVGGMLHADIRGSGNGNSPLLSVRLSKCLLSWKCSCGGGSGGSAHTNRIVTMKLTSAVVCARHPDLDLFQITNVDFSGLGVTEIDDTSAIAGLRRLNLSGNKLRGDSLWGIQWNRGLRHLDISRNQVDSLEHLAELNSLEVLNAGKNKIRMLKHLESLLNLKALILNDNEIAAVNDLGRFQELNTLAFSIGTPMLSLTKLVLSHNNLHEFPDLCSCPSLKELRLNGNKIATIPQLDLITPLLELLDLGNNPILAKSNILSIIVLRRLSNLSLKGCPLERDFLAGSGSVDAQLVVSKFPGIATFSGRPICARKKKRRRNDRR